MNAVIKLYVYMVVIVILNNMALGLSFVDKEQISVENEWLLKLLKDQLHNDLSNLADLINVLDNARNELIFQPANIVRSGIIDELLQKVIFDLKISKNKL